MSEWPHVALGDVLHRVRRSVILEDGRAYPAVSVRKDGQGLGPKEPFIGGVSKYQALQVVHDGDIVLRTITAFESPAGVALPEHDGSHVSGVFHTYEHTPEVDGNWLRLFFQTPTFWRQMEAKATGTVLRRKTISSESFLSIAMPQPPLDVQRRVVDLVGAIDANIEHLDQIVGTTGQVCEALLASLIVSAPGRPTTLGELAEWFSGGTPRATDRSFYEGGTIPWAVIADVQNGPISTTSAHINEKGMAEIGRVAPVGASLVTMYGTIGRVAYVKTAMATNQAIAWGVSAGELLPKYLYYVLRSMSAQLDALGRGATQRNINRQIVRSQGVASPTLQYQEAAIDALDDAFATVVAATAERDALRKARAALLPALLSGCLEVPVSYDELIGVP